MLRPHHTSLPNTRRFLLTALLLGGLLGYAGSWQARGATPPAPNSDLDLDDVGSVSFRERRIDKVVSEPDPASSSRIRVVATNRLVHAEFVINRQTGMTIDGTSPAYSPPLTCTIGNFTHYSSPDELSRSKYNPQTVVREGEFTYNLYDGHSYDPVTYDPIPQGKITYKLTASFLLITVHGVNVGSFIEPETDDLFDVDQARYAGVNPLPVDAPFGRFAYRNRLEVSFSGFGANIHGQSVYSGVVGRSRRSYGIVPNGQDLQLTSFGVTSSTDFTPPRIAFSSVGQSGLQLVVSEVYPQSIKLVGTSRNGVSLPPSLGTTYSFQYSPTIWDDYFRVVPLRNGGINGITRRFERLITLGSYTSISVGDRFVLTWLKEDGTVVTSNFTYK